MKMVDSALETLGNDVQNTCIEKILAALVRDSGGQKVPPIPKFLKFKIHILRPRFGSDGGSQGRGAGHNGE